MLPIEALIYLEQSMIQYGEPLRDPPPSLLERLVKRTVRFLSRYQNNVSNIDTQEPNKHKLVSHNNTRTLIQLSTSQMSAGTRREVLIEKP